MNRFEKGPTNAAYHYWGKTRLTETPDTEPRCHLLVYHSLDVAAVTYTLLHSDGNWCRDIANRIELSPAVVTYMMTLAMMMHDIGKFSKSFQSLAPDLFAEFFPESKPQPYVERHDTLGFLLWRGDPGTASDSLKSFIYSWRPQICELLEPIIRASFGHHGLPPRESGQGGGVVLRAAAFFDTDDICAVKAFLTACLTILGDPPDLPTETKNFRRHLRYISWTIAGLAVLTDWIGSNSAYFPYENREFDLASYWTDYALLNAEQALSEIGWHAHLPAPFVGTSTLRSLFPFIEEPSPLQQCAISMRLSGDPQLLIVEDATGAGKTEAAMLLAARIMANGVADGLYIGLPTMATSNAMYERMQKAYQKLYVDGEHPSLILSHGARHLSESFASTVVVHRQRTDKPYGAQDTASAMCNEWYADNRKKALLADVGIGTIDQALLSVLPARHQSLRLLGLHRKVLIVDEVHAYDSYMEHLLAVLLEAHARGGGSAVLLSATIPMKKKRELVAAFRKGLSNDSQVLEIPDEDAFPLVTRVGFDGADSYPVATRKEMQRSVHAEFVHSYAGCIELLESRALAGSCVCWIRNTVQDARRCYFDLCSRGTVAQSRISLFHSRFAMIDRARIEEDVLRRFGKASSGADRNGRILIATQVVEQSLDLDFDYMLTDLAPIDLVIQRAGRLHRHTRNQSGDCVDRMDGDKRGAPIITIFAPEFDEKADEDWLSGEFAGTAAIYRNPGILWRSHKILSEKSKWRTPEDARELIEAVYGEEQAFESPPGMDNKVIRAIGDEQSRKSMGHLNALVLSRGYCRNAVATDQWLDDELVSTRLSDETREVVLAVPQDGKLTPYAEIDSYPWDWSCLSVSERAWRSARYDVPDEQVEHVDELKSINKRLAYAEVVIVSVRQRAALSSESRICDIYDPHLGWGKSEEIAGESDQR